MFINHRNSRYPAPSGNAFGCMIAPVCLSLCNAVSFESLDLVNFNFWYSSSRIFMFVYQGHRSKNVYVYQACVIIEYPTTLV